MYKSQNTTHPNSKKRLAIVAVMIVVALLAITFILMRDSGQQNTNRNAESSDETINYDPATPDEKQEAEDTKVDGQTPTTGPKPVAEKVVISSAAQDPSSKDLVVQTKLYGSGWDTCTLTLAKGQQTITKSAKVLFQPDFSTCMGFVVKASEFTSGGEWKLSLQVTNTNGSPETAEKTINIQKE